MNKNKIFTYIHVSIHRVHDCSRQKQAGRTLALALFVNSIHMFGPVQFIVTSTPPNSSALIHLHQESLSVGAPRLHYHFLHPCHVEQGAVFLAPRNKVVRHCFVLALITVGNPSNHHRVIRKLRRVAGLCAVAEVCGVESEEEGMRTDRCSLPLPGSPDFYTRMSEINSKSQCQNSRHKFVYLV